MTAMLFGKREGGMEKQLSLSRISYASSESHSPISPISWLSVYCIVFVFFLFIASHRFLTYYCSNYFCLNGGSFHPFFCLRPPLLEHLFPLSEKPFNSLYL